MIVIFLNIFLQQIVIANSVIYISPLPDSKYNSEETNIIIGYSKQIPSTKISSLILTVTGSNSGQHTGKIYFAENSFKLIFKPDARFEFGEKVTVSGYNNSDSFSFFIRYVKAKQIDYLQNEMKIPEITDRNSVNNINPYKYSIDSLPHFTIWDNGPTATGYIFISNFSNNPTVANYLMILNNDGTPVFSRYLTGNGFDFKEQNDHLLTYYDEIHQKYLGLDNNYNIVDSFACGNGYTTDFHEVRVMSDSSAWLLSYDPEFVDMSKIITGGNPNATVTGLIVQKINAEKQVVFQWRSWDHYLIIDATHENLYAANIDYVHGNAIEIDYDGNIMISCRHLDEITKINSTTGDIIWRLGGKNNQFTFINDSIGFSHQHHVRRVDETHISLFDNGNYHTPSFSRAVEYLLDENNKTATLSWHYRHVPDIYSSAMGSVQKLSNGDFFIGWGSSNTTLTEITDEGSVVYELSLPPGETSYRAFRFNWQNNITGIKQNNTIASKYILNQNYPNPFNPMTKISFNITKSEFVTLKVYDILGKEKSTIVNKDLNAGSYSYSFDASNLSSGVYFYKLTSGSFSDVKRMVIIK
jgi:hypothetical protein